MLQKQFRICNEKGLHLRAAGEFVKEASKYPCDIWLAKDDMKVNAKSIMSILALIAGKNSTITIMTEGDKAEEALENLGKLVLDGFGENE
ncbi:HPr family phosphocarrier protein [bacterium]|nr:HPr family phosphocarrier protein [bacterium]